MVNNSENKNAKTNKQRETVEKIYLEALNTNVKIIRSIGNSICCNISKKYHEKKNVKYDVKKEQNTVYFSVKYFGENPNFEIALEIPEKAFESIDVNVTNGNIELSYMPTTSSLNTTTKNGQTLLKFKNV